MEDKITVRALTEKVGYQNEESVRRRIRVLRERGQVQDTGRPPADYPVKEDPEFEGLRVFWLSPQYFLVDPVFPPEFFPGRTNTEVVDGSR